MARHAPLLVLLALLACACWLGSGWAFARRLSARVRPPFAEAPPASWRGPPFEASRLRTRDGEELGLWFAPAPREARDAPTLLLLHGNGASRASCLEQAALGAREGCALALLALRAHGESSGARNDFGWSARADVVAAVDWLERRRPGAPVVVWGRSLGAAAALFAAPELGSRVAGYVLECPYPDLATAALRRFELHLPAPLARCARAWLWTGARLALPALAGPSPCEAARELPDVPVLVLAGSADRRAPPEDARRVAQAAGARARLVVIEGGGHLALRAADPAAHDAALHALLERGRGR